MLTLSLKQHVARHKLSVSASFCFPKPGLFPMPGLPPCGINHNRKQGAGRPTQPTCLLQISRRCHGVWSLPCLPVAEAFPSVSGLSGRSTKSSNYVQGSLRSNASKHPRAETAGRGWIRDNRPWFLGQGRSTGRRQSLSQSSPCSGLWGTLPSSHCGVLGKP